MHFYGMYGRRADDQVERSSRDAEGQAPEQEAGLVAMKL